MESERRVEDSTEEYSEEIKDLVIARLSALPSNIVISIGSAGTFSARDRLVNPLAKLNETLRQPRLHARRGIFFQNFSALCGFIEHLKNLWQHLGRFLFLAGADRVTEGFYDIFRIAGLAQIPHTPPLRLPQGFFCRFDDRHEMNGFLCE